MNYTLLDPAVMTTESFVQATEHPKVPFKVKKGGLPHGCSFLPQSHRDQGGCGCASVVVRLAKYQVPQFATLHAGVGVSPG